MYRAVKLWITFGTLCVKLYKAVLFPLLFVDKAYYWNQGVFFLAFENISVSEKSQTRLTVTATRPEDT